MSVASAPWSRRFTALMLSFAVLGLGLVSSAEAATSDRTDPGAVAAVSKAKKCKKKARKKHRCKRGPRGPQGPPGPAGPPGSGATKFAYDSAPGGPPATLYSAGGWTVTASCATNGAGDVGMTLTQSATQAIAGVQNSTTSLDGGPASTAVQYFDQTTINTNATYTLLAHAGTRTVSQGTADVVLPNSGAMKLDLAAVVRATAGSQRCSAAGYYMVF